MSRWKTLVVRSCEQPSTRHVALLSITLTYMERIREDKVARPPHRVWQGSFDKFGDVRLCL